MKLGLLQSEIHVVRLFVGRLKTTVGPNREEAAAELRTFHNMKLHNLLSSLNISGMIKSGRTKWLRRVACMED
jgi:hypothetical protein